MGCGDIPKIGIVCTRDVLSWGDGETSRKSGLSVLGMSFLGGWGDILKIGIVCTMYCLGGWGDILKIGIVCTMYCLGGWGDKACLVSTGIGIFILILCRWCLRGKNAIGGPRQICCSIRDCCSICQNILLY